MTTPATPGFIMGFQMEKAVKDPAHITLKQGKEEWQATGQNYHGRTSAQEVRLGNPSERPGLKETEIE